MLETSHLEIETGDGVTFSLPLAGAVSRFLALMVDWSIVIAAIWVISTFMGYIPLLDSDVKQALTVLAYFVLNMGYGVAFEWWWGGRTIGKKVVGLRVADITGLRLTFSQVLIRNLLRSVDSIPVFYLVGGTVMMLSKNMQRLGDIAAGTIVIRSEGEPLPKLPATNGSRINSMKPYRTLAARLRQKANPVAARVMLEALRRRDSLAPESRLELFATMAAVYRQTVEFPEEATLHLTDEQYLWNVAEILFEQPTRK